MVSGAITHGLTPRYPSIFLQDCINIFHGADHNDYQRARRASEEHPLQNWSEQVHDCVHSRLILARSWRARKRIWPRLLEFFLVRKIPAKAWVMARPCSLSFRQAAKPSASPLNSWRSSAAKPDNPQNRSIAAASAGRRACKASDEGLSKSARTSATQARISRKSAQRCVMAPSRRRSS